MPGPVDVVDNEITMSRRAELDEYLHKLSALKSYARYIVEHPHIRGFFSLRPGDGEVNVEPRRSEVDALGKLPEESPLGSAEAAPLPDQISRLRVSQHAENRLSEASRYDDDEGGRSSYYAHANGTGHARAESVNSVRRRADGASPRSHSPQIASQSFSRTHSPAPSRSEGRSRTPLEIDPYEANAASRSYCAPLHCHAAIQC